MIFKNHRGETCAKVARYKFCFSNNFLSELVQKQNRVDCLLLPVYTGDFHVT